MWNQASLPSLPSLVASTPHPPGGLSHNAENVSIYGPTLPATPGPYPSTTLAVEVVPPFPPSSSSHNRIL